MTFNKKNLLQIISGIGLIVLTVVLGDNTFSQGVVQIPLPLKSVMEPETVNPISPYFTERDSLDSVRDSIEVFGKEFLGVPYVYAGTSKAGFDCSGFVYFVFKQFDISVPRSSSQFGEFGKEVSIDSVKKGDILVFLSPTRDEVGHVGIVTEPNGMETEFIHASSSKEMQVMISSLKQSGYKKRFVKAIDVIGD